MTLSFDHLKIYVNTSRHIELLKSFECLLVWCDNVDQPFVGALLELLAGILILMGSSQDSYYLLFGRKRNRSADFGSVLLNCLDDLAGTLIDKLVIICLKCDSHYLVCHKKSRLLIVLFKPADADL